MADTTTADFTAAPEDEERELTKMSFLEHLEELRKRLIVSFVALGVAFLVCWNKNSQPNGLYTVCFRQ